MSKKKYTHKQPKADVSIRTYMSDGKAHSVINFRNGMDEFIEYSYVNLVIQKGCLYFEKGNADNGGVKLSRDLHRIQSSNQNIQQLLKEFNGEYPLRCEGDGVCYVCLIDKTEIPAEPVVTPTVKTVAVKEPTEPAKKNNETVANATISDVLEKANAIEQNEAQVAAKREMQVIEPEKTVEDKPQMHMKVEHNLIHITLTIQTLLELLNKELKTEGKDAKAIVTVLSRLLYSKAPSGDENGIVITIKTLLTSLDAQIDQNNTDAKAIITTITKLLESV